MDLRRLHHKIMGVKYVLGYDYRFTASVKGIPVEWYLKLELLDLKLNSCENIECSARKLRFLRSARYTNYQHTGTYLELML